MKCQHCGYDDKGTGDTAHMCPYFNHPSAIVPTTLITMTPQTTPTDDWKEAVIDACVIAHIGWDENDPRKSLHDLISWHVAVSLDPQVSSDAQALIERGRLEAAHTMPSNAPEQQDICDQCPAAYTCMYKCRCKLSGNKMRNLLAG